MEDDDEFGDLYSDVLLAAPTHPLPSAFASSAPAPPAAPKPAAAAPNSVFGSDDDEDGRILNGVPSSGRPPSPTASFQPPARSAREGGDEDWMLGEASALEEQPADWNDDEEEGLARVSSSQEADLPLGREEFRVSLEEEEEEVAGVLEDRQEEAEGVEQGVVVVEDADVSPTVGDALEATETDDGIGDLDQEPVIPGLSSASTAPTAFRGVNGSGDDKVSRSDDLDSDSEDDLQIVLNNDTVGRFGGNRNRVGGVEDEDDEDGEEDLVIVTDEDQNHHHQVTEEQEWGDEMMQQGPDGESSEAMDMAKGNGGVGARIGYGNHGFHGQHHSQFKYIRPGAAAITGGTAVGTGPPSGQVRPLPMGPMIGRPRGVQKNFHSGYGLPMWASGASARAYGSGLDFTLPSHKTIFDIDIDGFEEKPWRLPGIDTSDFFNFGLDEDSWRDYRKQLEQLRLEATMQSKIRVYESGRSEQDYDPDLPPELAAATGVQDIYAGSTQLGKGDGGQADLIGPGRGAMCSQPQLPTGRAIQVETGYGERLPSIDTRPPRIRDSDAIIEIVLQDTFDGSITSNGPLLDQRPCERERKEFRGDHKVEDHDRGAESEYFDRSPSYSGRKRQVKKGPFMGSIDSNVLEGNGILPSPSDGSLQRGSNSKSHSPVYAGEHYGASSPEGWTKESSRERSSHASDQHSNDDDDARQSDKLQMDDEQKEKSGASAEGKEVSQMSPTVPLETARDVTLEDGDEQNDNHTSDDVTEIEDKETASSLPVSGETHGDSDSYHAVKKQKLTSQVEQPAFQGDGVDSRVAHSDNSKAKAASSKGYVKRREVGEEEVMQRGHRQTGDLERHHDEEKRSSTQRKDVHGRDGMHEMDKYRVTSKGREDIYQSHQHMEPRQAHNERRSDGFERMKERDSSIGGRQRREDDAYVRRGKDEDTKRDQDKEIELRHKNKATMAEKKAKDDDIHSRKHVDDGDWKGHHYRDGTPRQRDRDDNLMNRRETLDDLHVKRRKDEEQRRREKVSKEDSQHGYRGREDGSHGKRERDDGTDHRRREDQARTRDKAENHHSIRHRDDNWRQREREDRLRLKQPREDTQKHKEREEAHPIARTGRVLEDRTTGGGGRANEVYPAKDRRRHGEQHRRVDRVEEHTRAEHEAHEEMHAREYQLSRKEKNSRHERLDSHTDHSLTADGGKMHKERLRKGKEIEVRDPNLTARKRKLENNSSSQNEVVTNGPNEQERINTSFGLLSRKGHHLTDEPPDIQGQNHSSENHEERAASDDDNDGRRGRSKLERWTSHKERDYGNSSVHSLSSSSRVREAEVNNDDMTQHDDSVKTEENNIRDSDVKGAEVIQTSDLTGKESDRHLDTVAKLKKRSERFKLPLPGDKETAMTKKTDDNEVSLIQSETVADADIKHERPARKRRWSSS